MARYIYEWKPTQHGNRLYRRPSRSGVVNDAVAAADYSSLKKDELVEVAEERALAISGTKADIIERLEADDDGED